MNRKEILNAIRRCAKKLKRIPTYRDLEAIGIGRQRICVALGGMTNALKEAGLAALGGPFQQTDATLLLDWARVASKLGTCPTAQEYERHGQFSRSVLQRRFWWSRVPESFCKFARRAGIEEKWKEVLAIARDGRQSGRQGLSADAGRDLQIYGAPLPWRELLHEPVNESGVIFAFGLVARRLGFAVRRFRKNFPDCEAMREVARGQWQPVRIEFEFESRNFKFHGHDPKGCDVIVCWAHNWPECPARLEVIELCEVIRGCEGLAVPEQRRAEKKGF